MEFIGSVLVLESGEWPIEANDVLRKKPAVIVLQVTPCPEKTWMDRQEIVQAIRKRNESLGRIGLVNHEFFAQFSMHEGYLWVAVEFPDCAAARKMLGKARKAGVTDIYLYCRGEFQGEY
ncbi:MAG: hypothetical protein KGI60_03470 [Patescibacteria group bacterium]|nr:hypothetical protein [Patescibacteria group bacterium]